ncbi:L-dopachrome tautomerase-related protein [Parapedobacter sp. DT-150]|uniref:L-dopachrome tautomerase-related protein n=1 Tax=Parapedobacter sp. DT-150 TaxID=3396162 RepID=UPI003F1AA4CE
MTKTMLFLLAMAVQGSVVAQPRFHSEELIPVASFGEYRAIGVGVSSANRVFVSFPNRGGAYKHALTEVVDGKAIPYPDETWNTPGDPDTHFASVQDLFVDAEDYLWVLDTKPAPGGSIFGGQSTDKAPEGQFKLVKISTKTNQVDRIFTFDDLDKSQAALNDVRVDTEKRLAYLSDPGQAAIVVLDLQTGKSRTVLKGTPFTLADPNVVLAYDGKEMRSVDGKPFSSHVNSIALTKDFRYFYFKPINQTHLFRIETQYLADSSLTDGELAGHVEDVGTVGVTHGLEADADGNIFLTTSMDYSISFLSPDGKLHTLVKDSRLLWPDSFGIGTDGCLYVSCAQLQRDPQWNDGESKVEFPYTLYKVKLP